MKQLFERLGIDYAQWKVLTRTALKLDLRGAPSLQSEGRRMSGATALLFQIGIYTLMGLVMTVLVTPIRDSSLAGMLLVTYTMFMIGIAALLDHNATIVSADDYAILGFRPIASRTFFAARLTNVLVYTTAMTTLFAYLPVLVTFWQRGAAIGFATGLAVYGGSTATALAMVASYTWLLRVVGADRLKQILAYVQLVMSTAVYGGYFLLSSVFTSGVRSGLELDRGPWLYFCPPAWYSSYVDLAAGAGSTREVLLAVLSVIVLVLLAFSLLGRLSMDYAERLGGIMTSSRERSVARPASGGWLFRRGEARAVAMLAWSQFRNDTKFQMTVLAILPMTLLYMFIGVRQAESGGVGDPGRIGRDMPLVTVAMLFFPIMLKTSLVRSDAYRAAWIFFTTPASRTRLLRSARDMLVVTFLLPYMLICGVAMVWLYREFEPVAIHLILIGLLSYVLLEGAILIDPELPFSKPVDKGRSSSRIFALTILTGVAATLFALVTPAVYGNTPLVIVLMAVLLGTSFTLDRSMRRRVEKEAAELEFEA
ncbi:MAG TPA: hypothetical protein VFP10_09325 [Candidatus Eisenbacteria bacterium]|nr:hypothetical protein [Candidatus Eisenbacteria bacterium]